MATSHKLSKNTKDSIVGGIIDSAFKERSDNIKNKRFAFSLKVYNDFYPESIREKMSELPDGWLVDSNEFKVQFGHTASGGCCRRMLEDDKLFLYKDTKGGYNQCLKVYDDEHPLTIEHNKLTKEQELLKELCNKTRRETRAMVESCNTTKQLKEAWPEIAIFVEQYEPTHERVNAIIPVLSGLNDALQFNKKD